jgi:DNA-binding transcriptional MerR regulator
MPYKEKTIEKLFWSIGEVAEELGVNTSLIRYWEKEFGTIKPKRTGRGDRLYTNKDIDLLRRIHHLVKDRGFTLQGAREALRRSEPLPQDRIEVVRSTLLHVREQLMAISRRLDH